jgi:hypothetical protein
MFQSKRLSQIREAFYHERNHPEPGHYNTWLVQRFITTVACPNDVLGHGSIPYACFAALLELHLSTAPWHVPYIGMEGLAPRPPCRYRGSYNTVTKEHMVDCDTSGMGWARLRTELDEHRTTLRWMTRFFQKHFDHEDQDLRAAFEDHRERFSLRIQDLEQVESQLRDYSAWEGIGKSCTMAEMSICESKRVMLRMK